MKAELIEYNEWLAQRKRTHMEVYDYIYGKGLEAHFVVLQSISEISMDAWDAKRGGLVYSEDDDPEEPDDGYDYDRYY